MTLKEKLLKLIEFDEWEFHLEALKMGYDSNSPRKHYDSNSPREYRAFEYGAKSLDSKLRPLLLALIECVEALEELKEHTASHLEDMQHYYENKCIPTAFELGQCASADLSVGEALARLSEIVQGK